MFSVITLVASQNMFYRLGTISSECTRCLLAGFPGKGIGCFASRIDPMT
jgi:hypothetical protein